MHHILYLRHLKLFKDELPCVNNKCIVCLQAKQTRLPFPVSNIKSTHCFDLIHIDVWGPYKEPTHQGYQYFLTIVDDFSRATWVYLLIQN